jgi:hypothetical protein
VIKVACHAKDSVDKLKLNFSITFTVQSKHPLYTFAALYLIFSSFYLDGYVQFYLMRYIDEKLFVFVEVGSFSIPSTILTIPGGVTAILTTLLRLCKLFKACKINSAQVVPFISLPNYIIDIFY